MPSGELVGTDVGSTLVIIELQPVPWRFAVLTLRSSLRSQATCAAEWSAYYGGIHILATRRGGMYGQARIWVLRHQTCT
jgi:hypothetical protein